VGREPVVQRMENRLSHWGAHEQKRQISIILAFEIERAKFHEFLKPAGLKAWNFKNLHSGQAWKVIGN